MEINLLKNYPKTKRDLKTRSQKTKEHQEIARKFGKEFFDGSRDTGYGGYKYDERFWDLVVQDFIKYYDLNGNSSILDVGCGKGFMLYDFSRYLPKAKLRGIDISKYAIENCISQMKDFLFEADCKSLPFKDNEFDLVISINTIHNHELEDCSKSIREIQRVSKKNSFIVVDAYETEEQKESLFSWNLTAKTILHTSEWKKLFNDNKFLGDYHWFCP